MENSPQVHNWEHRGIAPFHKNGGKWEPWLRLLLSFACGALSFAFLFGGKSRDLSDLLAWKDKTDKSINEIGIEFKRMDKDGTNRSHWVDEQQAAQINAVSARIGELEHRVEQRGEQINVMQGKIERLEGKIERLERETELPKNGNPK